MNSSWDRKPRWKGVVVKQLPTGAKVVVEDGETSHTVQIGMKLSGERSYTFASKAEDSVVAVKVDGERWIRTPKRDWDDGEID